MLALDHQRIPQRVHIGPTLKEPDLRPIADLT
jgi:hypothetical protein